jgi:hypothetical protein
VIEKSVPRIPVGDVALAGRWSLVLPISALDWPLPVSALGTKWTINIDCGGGGVIFHNKPLY